MGLSCSWVAIKAGAKADVLASLNLVETGHDVEPGCHDPNGPFSFSEKENGWLILVSEEGDFADRERVRDLSRFGVTVGCYMEEHVMMSLACAAENGAELWHVLHDSDRGDRHLEVTGAPPPELASIRARLFKQQDDEGGADYVFDIPLELAKAVCGYRTDEDPSLFTGLRRPGEPAGAKSGSGGGFFSWLFRR